MIKNITIFLCGLFVVLLAGCAGYNTTMFMTKSNVGLDFDAKPPTLEVNIARKEAVIAPSFEGGKTAPVMASFHAKEGTGSGFTSFFVGVDQTFAGGDAAFAMAKLYGNPTVSDKSVYNSVLHLSKTPSYGSMFKRVPGAGETRPLIFGTDTGLGLKAAWSGVGGAIPDTVKIGFNRKEFAWAPLSATPTTVKASGESDGTAVDVKMPSFLATIQTSQTIGGKGTDSTNKTKVSAMQYFATGDSATYLAMQRDVRAAMLARMDPNEKAFKNKFGEQAQAVLSDTLFAVKTILDRLKPTDPVAADLLNKLNNLQDLKMPARIADNDCPEYSFNTTDPAKPVIEKNISATAPLGKTLADVIAYLSFLNNSKAHLSQGIDSKSSGKPVQSKVGAGGVPSDITPAVISQLLADLKSLTEKSDAINQYLAANRDVIAAYRYVETMVSPQ